MEVLQFYCTRFNLGMKIDRDSKIRNFSLQTAMNKYVYFYVRT